MSDLFETARVFLIELFGAAAEVVEPIVDIGQHLTSKLGGEVGSLSLEAWIVLIFVLALVNYLQVARLRRRVRKLETVRTDDRGLGAGVTQLQQQMGALAHELQALEMHVFAETKRPATRSRM